LKKYLTFEGGALSIIPYSRPEVAIKYKLSDYSLFAAWSATRFGFILKIKRRTLRIKIFTSSA